MSKTLLIDGGKLLEGEVKISGSKNCALCLIAGSLLSDKTTILYNIPDIKDIRNFIKTLECLNVKMEFSKNKLIIDTSSIKYSDLINKEISEFRASYYLIGSLINRFKKIKINDVGGCNFTLRPINYHLDFFNYFGVKHKKTNQGYIFKKEENYNHEYTLPYPSFGATVNALLFAVSSQKNINIKNICLDVEILTFIKFLKCLGANVVLNNNEVNVKPSSLHEATFTNIPDRIESGTFLLMGPILFKKMLLKDVNVKHNLAVLKLFDDIGVKYLIKDNLIEIEKQDIKKSINITTGINEGLSSDLQPLLSVFCLNVKKISLIKETVYNSRFSHVSPLQKMGGEIYQQNNVLLINGIMELIPKKVVATDLRMTSAMIFAMLCSKGKSVLYNADYLDRGYEDFVNKIKSVGGIIDEI